MILVRNSRYWGPHTAYLDRVVLRFCQSCPLLATPAQVLAGLRQRDVDMAFTRDPTIISGLRSIPGVKVLASRLNAVDFLHLRVGAGGHPALRGTQGKLVRRALAYGIDREAMARTILGELDPTYPASDSAVLWNTHRYYGPNWSVYRYRPALARRLLEQAGCRRGADRIYVCAGERLSLRLRGDLRRAVSRAYCRADTALPAAGRCRGSAQLRACFDGGRPVRERCDRYG